MKIRFVTVFTAGAFALSSAVLLVPSLRAAADAPAIMIEVEGEATKYWSRWRGPSGQGLVKDLRFLRRRHGIVLPDDDE